MTHSELFEAVLNLSDEHIGLLFKVAKQLAIFQERGCKIESMKIKYSGVCE